MLMLVVDYYVKLIGVNDVVEVLLGLIFLVWFFVIVLCYFEINVVLDVVLVGEECVCLNVMLML